MSTPKVVHGSPGLTYSNGFWTASFGPEGLGAGGAVVEPVVVFVEKGRESVVVARELQVAIDDGLLTRVVATGASEEGHGLRITYDVHALVNVGLPRAALPVSVELDERTAGSQAELVDPADSRRLAELTSHENDGKLEFEVPSLKEGSVAVVRLTRNGAE